MEIDWALPARQAVVQADGTISVDGGAVDTLVVPSGAGKAQVALSIAARVRGPMSQWREPGHDLRVEVLDRTGAVTRRLREPLREIEPPSHLHVGAEPGRLISLRVAWEAQPPGSYQLQVCLDGQLTHTFDVAVVSAEDLTRPRG